MNLYQHGRRTKPPRNSSVVLAVAAIVGLVVLISWWIVHKDIDSNTDAKTTVPIVTEVGEEKKTKFIVNETYFTFELPEDWKLLERRNESYINAYIYVSTKKGADDRKLTVHVDIMPQDQKLVKLQPLTSNGSGFLLGNLSDKCVNFAGDNVRQGSTATFPAKWENVTFTCDPIVNNQTIGTGSVEGGIATTLGRRKYFLFYEDHNIHPDDQILIEALRSFKGK